MSVCSHFFTLKNNSSSYVSDNNQTLKQTLSISSASSIQEIEAEAAAYSAKRAEVKVIYSPASTNNEQSILVTVPTWGDPTKLASFFAPSIEELLPIAGWRGSGVKQFLLATRDIHLMMREQYTQMIHQVGRNIFPCIVASDNDMHCRGVGSMFSLYLADGSIQRTKTPPPEYEIYKNLAHMPLAIYTIISPYLLQPTVGGWEDKLRMMGSKITVALSAMDSDSNIQSSKHPHYLTMLVYTQEYIQQCLDCKAVHASRFQKYCQSMLPFVTVSMARAAEIQVASAKPQLEAWKLALEAIGEWTNTYVIIPTVWPVGQDNPRQRLFKQLMNEEQFKTHVIISEMPRDTEESFNLLGRVVGDRIAARLIFGCSTAGARSMVCALSTERDLVSDACQDAIQKLFGEDTKKSVGTENKNGTGCVLTPLTAMKLRAHAAELTSSELQKSLLHTAALMEIDEEKSNENVSQVSGSAISCTSENVSDHDAIPTGGHNLRGSEAVFRKSVKY